MGEQDLTSTVTELIAQIARMQAELDSLKAHTYAQPVQQPIQLKPEVSTTRRKVLRRLAGGLVAGLAVGGVGFATPAEAKLTSNPASNGQSERVGMLVVPPGATVTGTLGGSTKVGLVVGGDTSFNIGAFGPTVNAAILAYTSNNGSAIVGQTQTGTAVYGQSDSNFGVVGQSISGVGVKGKGGSVGVFGTTDVNFEISALPANRKMEWLELLTKLLLEELIMVFMGKQTTQEFMVNAPMQLILVCLEKGVQELKVTARVME